MDWIKQGYGNAPSAQGAGEPGAAGGGAPSPAFTQGVTDIVSKLGDGNVLLAQLIEALTTLSPRKTGQVTLGAADTTVVVDAAVVSSSYIPTPTPLNAAAATLMGSTDSLYVVIEDGQFSLKTASGNAAAGTESFAYAVYSSL